MQRCLPIRIFLNDQKLKIQRAAKIEKNKENKTLKEFFKEIFPELFNGSSKILNNTKVLFSLFIYLNYNLN